MKSNHPNVISILGYCEINNEDDGYLFYVIDLYDDSLIDKINSEKLISSEI